MSIDRVDAVAVRVVSRLAPWLAPVPSAYFVARSALAHLTVSRPMAWVIALIIETLGLTTMATALQLHEWNVAREQDEPSAPMALALGMGGLYVLTTLGLVLLLEVWPVLVTYAPALFPLLAVVGTVNLAMAARQNGREAKAKAREEATREGRAHEEQMAALALASEKEKTAQARAETRTARLTVGIPQEPATVRQEPARTATIEDWRAISAGLDGRRAECDTALVRELLQGRGLAEPSASSMQHWAQGTREGTL